MSNRIFILNDQNKLIGMEEKRYDTEDLLQRLLSDFPALLGSDQIGNSPRNWVLISREIPVPDMEDALGRWSLDHLFLDQDGIPTLVEVKRSTDTRIRREVVGQMLDYAANAVVYWKIDEIRARFEARCDQENIDPDTVLSEYLQIDDVDSFWQTVRTNLLAGKVRLLFVADAIPHELQRIIEFLNKQMNPAEVLGIEIKRYAGQGLHTLVPTVIGQSAEVQQSKSGSRSLRQWDETSFFAELENKHGEEIALAVYEILKWSKARGLNIWWGQGQTNGSFFPRYFYGQNKHFIVAFWTAGGVEVQFQHMRPPFDTLEMKSEFMKRLNLIQGVDIPEDGLERRPTFPLEILTSGKNLEDFLNTLDWFLEKTIMYYENQ
jgi:hypothetical protein